MTLINQISEACYIEENTRNLKIENITSIKVHVSNDCNLACSYCYENKGNYGQLPKIMTYNEGKIIASFIKENFKKIKFLLQTNGTIYTEDIHQLIEKYNIDITVSIDGSKEIHDTHRVYPNSQGTYDIILKNVKLYNKNKPIITFVQATYTKQSEVLTKDQVAENIIKEFKVPRVYVGEVYTNDENLKVKIEIPNSNGMARKFFEDVFENRFNNSSIIKSILSTLLSKNTNKYFCNAGVTQVSIDCEGTIWPCQLFTGRNKYKIGTINDNIDLIKINLNNLEHELHNKNKLNNTPCYSCSSNFWCRKCVAEDIDDNKNIIIFEDYCDFYNKITSDVLDEFCEIIINNKYDEFSERFKQIYSMELI